VTRVVFKGVNNWLGRSEQGDARSVALLHMKRRGLISLAHWNAMKFLS